jgi:hypothetical protein
MNNPPGGLRLLGGFLCAYMPPHERVGGIAAPTIKPGIYNYFPITAWFFLFHHAIMKQKARFFVVWRNT